MVIEVLMKRLLLYVFITAITCSYLVAQEKTNKKELQNKSQSTVGYLVDRSCAKRMVMDDVKKSDAKAARHTKECCLDDACRASGFGIITGGTLYKFDDDGNKKAVEYLNTTKKEDNIKVVVLGSMEGDIISVASIKDFSSPGNHPVKKK
jgi:hypothetical protein